MNVVQVLKFCIVGALFATLITGTIFIMRSSDDREMHEHVKSIIYNSKRKEMSEKATQEGEFVGEKQPLEAPKELEEKSSNEAKNVVAIPAIKTPTNNTTTTTVKAIEVTIRPEILKQLKEVSGRPPSIHIFYYPWYGSPEFDNKYLHWNHVYLKNWDKTDQNKYPEGSHKPPGDIGSVYYPQLGPYSSSDPTVIDKHMKWISSAGVDVVAVSWYPEGLADDNGNDWNKLIPLLLNVTHKYKMKLTFHLEPYQRRTAESVRKDIQYIVEKYGSHPALYRTSRKNATGAAKDLPLLYVYDSCLVPVDDWAKITHHNGSLSIRNTSHDVLLIGLYVQMEDRFKLKKAGFDGLYTYFASDGFSHGSTMANWPSLSAYCAKNDLLFIPSVGPGYDDTRVRPWNSKNIKERNKGEYYREHFKMAHSSKADIVSITSFNEWHEGTQIEPAIPFKDENSTEYVYMQYDKGPEQYLEITLEMVKAYFTPHHENIPMQIERIV